VQQPVNFSCRSQVQHELTGKESALDAVMNDPPDVDPLPGPYTFISNG